MKHACVVATSKTLLLARTFIGPSIDVSKGHAEGDNAGRDNLDRVNVRLHFDTQTPNFDISTRLHGKNADLADDMVSTRIYAKDLQWDNGKIGIYAVAPG